MGVRVERVLTDNLGDTASRYVTLAELGCPPQADPARPAAER